MSEKSKELSEEMEDTKKVDLALLKHKLGSLKTNLYHFDEEKFLNKLKDRGKSSKTKPKSYAGTSVHFKRLMNHPSTSILSHMKLLDFGENDARFLSNDLSKLNKKQLIELNDNLLQKIEKINQQFRSQQKQYKQAT